jgi:hypothetical protein
MAIATSSASGVLLRASSRSISIIRRTASIKSDRHSSRVSPWPFAPGASRHVAQNPLRPGRPAARSQSAPA